MAKISIADFKVGEAFIFRGDPFVILSVRAKHLGRGGAIYRTKMKNLKTDATLEEAFRPTDKFETVDLSLETMNFMYRAGDEALFMHPRTYDQISLSLKKIGSFVKFLKEGENYRLQFIADEPVGILPPAKIKRLVIEAPEAIAGNTATAATKKVIIEGGAQIETPLFIKTGDIIIIRTEDEGYVSKAQEGGK
ncbi:MAG: elongation factor P [Candidatus Shapirobacteria bacterium]|nr:elongation factor P [Candidatus Shapirobacteria bacterium]MDD5073835.1 elongation factor P [Candidatus Shapirobacteria bacterium]MDD5481819.1 elongation factor P [Candidatus Shapirobacteria bacterium]